MKRPSKKVSISKDGSQTIDQIIEPRGCDDINDPETLLNYHGYDTSKWELITARNSVWDTQIKGGSIRTLYASKITVKPKEESIDLEKLLSHFKNFVPVNVAPKRASITRRKKHKKMLEIPIMDLHVGKLCNKDLSGSEYNLKIVEDRLGNLINDILIKYKNEEFDKILFVFGNDYFHYDNKDKTTSNGTIQDSDVMVHEMFEKGVELLINSINALVSKAPVEVMYIPGNHDKTIGFFALQTIKAWFRNDEWVKVHDDYKTRQYFRYGNSLIGFSHGDKDAKKIETLMPIEARGDWGETIYKEFHLGHLHSESTKEINGIIIRRLSSLCGTDNWHNESGYVGSIKRSLTFVWDHDGGLTDIKYHTVK